MTVGGPFVLALIVSVASGLPIIEVMKVLAGPVTFATIFVSVPVAFVLLLRDIYSPFSEIGLGINKFTITMVGVIAAETSVQLISFAVTRTLFGWIFSQVLSIAIFLVYLSYGLIHSGGLRWLASGHRRSFELLLLIFLGIIIPLFLPPAGSLPLLLYSGIKLTDGISSINVYFSILFMAYATFILYADVIARPRASAIDK